MIKQKILLATLLALLAAAPGCSNSHHPPAHAADARVVAVIHPQRGEAVRAITLPGDLVGFYESTLYSKVTGYLQSISVDKGDRVKKGQVLAEIEVPELERRVERAKADLQVQHLTYERLEQVWKSDPRLVARQDVDIAEGRFREAKAAADELETLAGYTRIVAPFDGVVTGRFVDPGALIKAGGEQTTGAPSQGSAHPGGAATPVVSLAMIDVMRIYVYAPQGVVSMIRRGMAATLTLQDFPGRTFDGTITRFATSLDLSTRTMLTEIDLPNPKHELYPGMYANVTLQLERHLDAIKLPDAAVGHGAAGTYVFIARKGKLIRVPVTVGINTGHYAEITSGLAGDERVVAAVDPTLSEGEPVRPLLQPIASLEGPPFAANSH
jgi:membrane fusion protein, multidrug efflux system